MRRADPVGYAVWYNHYINNMQQSTTYSNDRGSVHSGQSSSNQRHAVHTLVFGICFKYRSRSKTNHFYFY
jgi:hypothetical protein